MNTGLEDAETVFFGAVDRRYRGEVISVGVRDIFSRDRGVYCRCRLVAARLDISGALTESLTVRRDFGYVLDSDIRLGKQTVLDAEPVGCDYIRVVIDN